MRTNIVIDDALMSEAQAALGTTTKRETVETALRHVIAVKRRGALRQLRGIGWDGDLDAMRRD